MDDDTKETSDSIAWAKESIDRFDAAHARWCAEADKIVRFKAGRQWDDGDLKLREERKVPTLVFNYFGDHVNKLVGVQVKNRSYIHYKDLGPDDFSLSAVLNQQARASMTDEFEDEITDSFEDVLTTGVGCVFVTTHTEGDLVTASAERIPSREAIWDPAATRRNFRDRRWCGRRKRYSRREMVAIWGKDKADQCQEALNSKTRVRAEVEQELPFEVVHFQWEKLVSYTRHRLTHKITGQVFDVPGDEFDRIEGKEYFDEESYECVRPIYRQMMFCDDIELESESSLPFAFTYAFMTGFRDHDGTFHSPMRAGIDPQSFSNVAFSTAIHDYSTAGKGIMAEDGAADDMDAFVRDFSDSSRVKRLAPGGLNRVRQLDGPSISPALGYFMDLARTSIGVVLGISPELMGSAHVEQSNILERTRQDASLTGFQSVFASERMLRKEVGRLLLGFMTRYYPDYAFLRVSGQEAAAALPKIREIDVSRADIQIDEEPRTVSQRVEILDTLRGIAHQMGPSTPPGVMSVMMKYLPLPPTDIQAIAQSLNQGPGPQEQVDLQKSQAEVENLRAKTMEIVARVQSPPAQAPLMAERVQMAMQGQAAQLRALDDQRKSQLSAQNHAQDMEETILKARLDETRAQLAALRSSLQSRSQNDA